MLGAGVNQGVGRIAVHLRGCGLNRLQLAGEVGLLLGPTVVGTVGLCDFAEVARPGRGDDEDLLAGALFGGKRGRQAAPVLSASVFIIRR